MRNYNIITHKAASPSVIFWPYDRNKEGYCTDGLDFSLKDKPVVSRSLYLPGTILEH